MIGPENTGEKTDRDRDSSVEAETREWRPGTVVQLEGCTVSAESGKLSASVVLPLTQHDVPRDARQVGVSLQPESPWSRLSLQHGLGQLPEGLYVERPSLGEVVFEKLSRSGARADAKVREILHRVFTTDASKRT
jgi:hypothetical protein